MTERSVHRVPLDIWFRIAPALSRKDLMALCTISSHFLPFIRPLFYRVVKLRSDAKGSRATVNLLARDRSLASFVVELVLIQHTLLLPGTRRGPLISLESLGNMTSLRRITLCGIVFNSQTEQHDFGALLRLKTSTTLEQVTYRNLAYAEWWPSDGFGLGGLEVIEWDARGKGVISFALFVSLAFQCVSTDGLRPLWAILSESRQSCHTLRLPLFVFEHNQCRHQLQSIHLPNLRSLSVLPPTSSNPQWPIEASHHVVEQLLSYDGIEELDMSCLDVTTPAFQPGTLPHLHSLATTASTLRAMKNAHMNCLSTTLGRLKLRFDMAFISSVIAVHDFDSLLQASMSDADHFHGLSVLQELELVFPAWTVDRVFSAVVHQCTRSYGSSLEVWRGNVLHPATKHSAIFATVFASFSKLRVIEFTTDLLGYALLGRQYYDELCTRSVRLLANTCPALEEVRAGHFFTKQRHFWEIDRRPEDVSNRGLEVCNKEICAGHSVHVSESDST